MFFHMTEQSCQTLSIKTEKINIYGEICIYYDHTLGHNRLVKHAGNNLSLQLLDNAAKS